MLTMKQKIEKHGALASAYGPGAFSLACDSYYIGDLSDESLSNLYNLVHSDFEEVMITPKRNEDIVRALQAEVALRREFQNRGLSIPETDYKKLNASFKEIAGKFAKQADEILKAVTPPDVKDGHVHKINDLTKDGSGTTDEAGDPLHSHNVDSFMTLAVEIQNYKSDHPGKVEIKKRTDFRITKKNEDGSYEWQSDYEFIKLDEEKRLVGGVVYEPEIVDAQDDSASAEEIEKACHRYMIRSQVIGVMHSKRLQKDESILVENFIAPCNYIEGTQIVRKGSWVQVHKVIKDDLWKEIKEGKYTGFSMAGKARDISSKAPLFGKLDKMEIPNYSIQSISSFLAILKSNVDVEKVIRQRDGKWCVLTEDEKKVLGCHDTREDAFKQLAAVEANKSLTPRHLSDTKIDIADVKKICPACAKEMKKNNLKKISLKKLVKSSIYKKEPTTVQTLIFAKDKFSKEEAKSWAKNHNFASSNVEENENSFRLRQKDPGKFNEGSYKTISLAPGVKAVIGKVK